MTKDLILIDINMRQITWGFINSNGEIEYTIYKSTDGGVLDGDPDSDIGAILANETGIVEYQEYELTEIK